MEQQQEFLEVVEAHKEEESCTEEEPKWYRNHTKMLVTHLSVPQAEETKIKTTE